MKQSSKSGVYVIENLIDGKYYIGSSKNIRVRKMQHFSDLKNNRHTNRHLQGAFNKYGEENFKFEILEYCGVERRLPREQKWIDLFNDENCYNMCVLAHAPSLGKGGFSKETIEGMRQRMSDPERNPMSKQEYRDKISKAHSMFDSEKADELCREYLAKLEIIDLAEREGCSRRAIETAIANNINKYISGVLTLPEHRWKLKDKRNLYNLDEYIEMYETYMESDIPKNKIEDHFDITTRAFGTVLKWFEKGNELYGLEPDVNFVEKKRVKDERMSKLFRKYPDSFYLKLLNEYNSGQETVAGLSRKYECDKSWIKTARRLEIK